MMPAKLWRQVVIMVRSASGGGRGTSRVNADIERLLQRIMQGHKQSDYRKRLWMTFPTYCAWTKKASDDLEQCVRVFNVIILKDEGNQWRYEGALWWYYGEWLRPKMALWRT